MRRSNANAIIRVAPDAVVNQVMRHNPLTGYLANAYLNHQVSFNMQDAYLERDPSADGLTQAFTHISIRCNPEVPKEIPKSKLNQLPPDPDIMELSNQIKRKSYTIRVEYKFIRLTPKSVRREYAQIRQDLINAEKRFRDKITTVYQEAYRRQFHDNKLERQLHGEHIEKEVKPILIHHLSERTYLQKILCDFNTSLSIKEITERKVKAIDSMVALVYRREIRGPILKKADENLPSIPALEGKDLGPPAVKAVESFPLVLKKTQYIYCVRDEQLSHADRTRKFSRISHMMDHIERVHLTQEPARATWVCHHPNCKPLGDFLKSLDHFKSHIQKVHGIKLHR